MELLDFDEEEDADPELEPLVNELSESDSVDARAIRQIAVEDILAKVILCLYRIEELYQELLPVPVPDLCATRIWPPDHRLRQQK